MDYIIRGFKQVYETDIECQKDYLSIISSDIRNCPLELFTDNYGVFIPNNEYMIKNFGEACAAREYTSDRRCIWNNAVIFPIYDILDKAVAILGYFPLNKLNTEVQLPSYKVSSTEYFDRRKFFFAPKGVMRKALEDDYVVLTDGVFDTLSLNHAGINAMALMGSYVSKEQIAYLTLLKRVYITVDNDRAGTQLLKTLHKHLSNLTGIRFNLYKDVDDVLKSEHRDKFLNQIKKDMANGLPGDIIVRL